MSSKISKNIKQLRNEHSMTQDVLAEKLCVTRQAISSWENDRTQPDVMMVEKLSEIFGCSIEEVIYGKKRNTEIETERKNYTSTLVIVFSVLGALLVGAGAVLVFVNFWLNMSLAFKTVLSFVPVCLGFACALFVLLKKNDSLPFKEGGAILWSVGVAATLIMLKNLFGIAIEDEVFYFLICVLVLPVSVIFKSISAMFIHYAFLICGMVNLLDSHYKSSEYIDFIVVLFFTATTILQSVYFYFNYKKACQSTYSVLFLWFSFIAASAMFLLFAVMSGETGYFIIALCALSITLLLIGEREPSYTMPFKLFGFLGVAVSILCFASSDFPQSLYVISVERIVALVLILLTPIVVFVLLKDNCKDKLASVFLCVVSVCLAIYVVGIILISKEAELILGENHRDIGEKVFLILKFAAFLVYIMMIALGARERKLYPMNVGFIFFMIYTMMLISQLDTSLLENGILLLIFGAVLLSINLVISKAKLAENKGSKEVAGNEK